MKEIKFRAWNSRLGIMSDYVTAIQIGDTEGTPSSVNVIVNGNNETWDIEHDNVVLEQFTGLKDKNSKDIYENDIVKSIEPIGLGKIRVSFYKIIFNRSSAQFQLQSLKNEYMLWAFYSGGISSDPLVVAGDIHNNPDLLEVSE